MQPKSNRPQLILGIVGLLSDQIANWDTIPITFAKGSVVARYGPSQLSCPVNGLAATPQYKMYSPLVLRPQRERRAR